MDPSAGSGPPVLPDRVQDSGLLLRRWCVDDAPLQHCAVSESIEHLRPWMAWVASEPLALDRRRALLDEWERDWARGGAVYFAVIVHGRVAGSAGLHRRRGRGVLEIGYWTHPSFLRQGVASHAARMLTEAAFSVAEIERVEIHHDKANVASAGVPRRLGYRLAAETPRPPAAPAELGVDCAWRMTRDDWSAATANEQGRLRIAVVQPSGISAPL